MKLLNLVGTILLGISATSYADDTCGNPEREVFADKKCTKIETYKSNTLSANPILAITLHGDNAYIRPYSQYRVAQKIAKERDNVVAVGMLRPGYTDDFGRTSDGEVGLTVGDNYDDARVDQIASAITALKRQHKAKKVVLIGHSGGAAITARLIGLYPDLVNHAVAISCPCDINAWRKDMLIRNEYEPFRGDIDISSPVELVSKVSNSTKVSLIVAEDDDVTKPYLTKSYYTALKNHHKDVEMQLIAGDHNIYQVKPVMDMILKAL
ncbi:alpha/beta hydrolase family protein (plasmid) [Pseudoalteromonas sp. T1lg65]|uniref:alpha/beta hydrolase family protein n=1 Tax=Pseudoalteromonas sp. T1lg65 TaxID=2077101 RepID=UPI003F7AF0F6